MSFYQRITPLQEPSDLGVDKSGLQIVGFNILATRTKTPTFIEELVKVLETAAPPMPGPVRPAVATYGTNLFGSSAHNVPSGDGPFLSIVESGGPGAIFDHNEGIAYLRSTAQITARATTYAAARTMAWAAYDALVVVTNFTVTP